MRRLITLALLLFPFAAIAHNRNHNSDNIVTHRSYYVSQRYITIEHNQVLCSVYNKFTFERMEPLFFVVTKKGYNAKRYRWQLNLDLEAANSVQRVIRIEKCY